MRTARLTVLAGLVAASMSTANAAPESEGYFQCEASGGNLSCQPTTLDSMMSAAATQAISGQQSNALFFGCVKPDDADALQCKRVSVDVSMEGEASVESQGDSFTVDAGSSGSGEGDRGLLVAGEATKPKEGEGADESPKSETSDESESPKSETSDESASADQSDDAAANKAESSDEEKAPPAVLTFDSPEEGDSAKKTQAAPEGESDASGAADAEGDDTPADDVAEAEPEQGDSEQTAEKADDEAEPTPAAYESEQNYGPVRSGETLNSIVTRHYPAGISQLDAIATIFNMNPSAFNGDNPNSLRAGADLELPAVDDIQTNAWDKLKARTASKTKSASRPAPKPDSEPEQAQTPPSLPGIEPGDEVQVLGDGPSDPAPQPSSPPAMPDIEEGDQVQTVSGSGSDSEPPSMMIRPGAQGESSAEEEAKRQQLIKQIQELEGQVQTLQSNLPEE